MNLSKSQLVTLFIAFILVFIQGVWIFFDARRRKEKHYWLWGAFGLLNVPSSLIVYLLVTRLILDKDKKE